MAQKLLTDLLGDLSQKHGSLNPTITGICVDSRRVRPGDLFVALPGLSAKGPSGEHFIQEALSKGAVAVLSVPKTASDLKLEAEVPFIESKNPRKALAQLAARFYVQQPECMVAVTGTNGKSSVVSFCQQIWQHLGLPAASLGTLGLKVKDGPLTQKRDCLTTPDAVTLHQALDQLAQEGVTHGAIEASSHGLHQHRLDGVRLQAAGFTNFTHEHLDYHKTASAYFSAKKRLFRSLLPAGGTAVLNADIPEYSALVALCKKAGHNILSYGEKGDDITLRDPVYTHEGQTFTVTAFGQTVPVTLPLVGHFQSSNVLCALGLVIAAGADPAKAIAALSKVKGVEGRLEFAGRTPSGGRVYVDFAHTPHALESILTSLRSHCTGRLHVVFGCGGDRDVKKRSHMGEIAAALADQVFITDDNPRSEVPAEIRRAVLMKCPRGLSIGDRRMAIFSAVAKTQGDDILVIAGKGHETGQIIRDQVIEFDDIKVAREAISMLKPQAAS